jgi:uncharacterized membrane protein YvbJ
MKYCSQCGAEIKVQQAFCIKCGYKFNSIKENETKLNENFNNTQSINADNSTKNNFVLSKKMKISIIGASIIAILLIIFFKTGNALTQPSKVVSNFEKAISSDNKKELSNILYCKDKRLEISEKSIAPLLSYFNENPSYLNTVTQALSKEALTIKMTKNLSNLDKNNSKDLFNVVYEGKKFIFFPNYKISIMPSFIQVNTSIKDVSLSLNDIKLGKSDTDNFSKEFGPFIPGKYNLSAVYKGKYLSLNEPYSVNFFDNENMVDNKKNIDVLLNTNYIMVKSEYSDAKIFVNGKDTGIKAADAQNFGPLSSGMKIYAVATENGNQLKSDEYTIEQGDKNIYLSFEEAKNVISSLESNLKDLMNNYSYYFCEAVNMNNFSMLEPYLYPKSKLYNEQLSYIPTTYNSGLKEYVTSLNILSYKLNADNKSGTITTQETYNIDKKGTPSVKTFKYTYTFKYNEEVGRYQIDSISDNQI